MPLGKVCLGRKRIPSHLLQRLIQFSCRYHNGLFIVLHRASVRLCVYIYRLVTESRLGHYTMGAIYSKSVMHSRGYTYIWLGHSISNNYT